MGNPGGEAFANRPLFGGVGLARNVGPKLPPVQLQQRTKVPALVTLTYHFLAINFASATIPEQSATHVSAAIDDSAQHNKYNYVHWERRLQSKDGDHHYASGTNRQTERLNQTGSR